MANRALAATLLVLATLQRSFVDPAAVPAATHLQPVPPQSPVIGQQQPVQTQQDEEEVELENLKKPAASSVSMVQSHSERRLETPDLKQRHSDMRQQVSLDGRLVAALESSLDSSPQKPGVARAYLNMPQLGVSQSVEAPLPPQQRRTFPVETVSQRAGQVTALDMAQYIFWTGDERGVSLAIQEFLHQGLPSQNSSLNSPSMTREEAVAFLREIRQGLDALQAYYAQRRDEQQAAEQQALERAAALQQALQGRLSKKSVIQQQLPASSASPLLSEEEYSELLQRLREADALYTELALEEIIYQLAKELFVQKLERGHGDAQSSLQNFSTLIRSEAEGGRIARTLETKLQDVLGASLMDALREKPRAIEDLAQKPAVTSQTAKNIGKP